MGKVLFSQVCVCLQWNRWEVVSQITGPRSLVPGPFRIRARELSCPGASQGGGMVGVALSLLETRTSIRSPPPPARTRPGPTSSPYLPSPLLYLPPLPGRALHSQDLARAICLLHFRAGELSCSRNVYTCKQTKLYSFKM